MISQTRHKKMSEGQTKAGNQEHSLTRSHSLTLSFTHSRHAEQLCFHVYAQKSLSHTPTLSHSLTLSLSH